VILNKDGEDQLDWSCEKWESIAQSQNGEEYHTYSKKRKVNCIGHILRRNCLLKHVIKGKIERGIEVKGRQGRRRKHLLNDLNEMRGCCKSTEEALDRTVWRSRFEKRNGPVVRQTKERMNWILPATLYLINRYTKNMKLGIAYVLSYSYI
jgi:hypothetical protein